MQEEEGACVACSFWMIDALVRSNQVGRATATMDRAVDLASGLGLLAEQINVADGSFLGNFPQGLSHLALINAAHGPVRAAVSGGSPDRP